jgi:glycosyltransferase involved in cell wall biosynthesis
MMGELFPMNHVANDSTSTACDMSPAVVSIVIPCYRGERFLAEAIESCLAQTHQAVEVVVVDDASPDGCLAIAERFAQTDPRVRIVRRSQNGGVSRAFNDGFAAARGEYLTRLAQDDVFEPFAVERMIARLREGRPGAGLVYCDFTEIDDAGNVVRDVIRTPPPEDVLAYGNRMGLCVMWSREVWQTVGGFNPDFDAAEDYEYWLRVTTQFGMIKCEGPPAMRVRTHASMGSFVFAEKQLANTYRALRAVYGTRLSLNRFRRERQIALARAHLTAAHIFRDQSAFGKALVKVAQSFLDWPLPLPERARTDGEPSWIRARMFCVLSRCLVFSLVAAAGARGDAARKGIP